MDLIIITRYFRLDYLLKLLMLGVLLQAYLKFEQSLGDPARIQILYERAITEFPISSELWLDYTNYMDRTLKVILQRCLLN